MDFIEKKIIVIKKTINILLIIAGMAILILLLFKIQMITSKTQQKTNSNIILDEISSTLKSNEKTVNTLTDRYNEMNQSIVTSIGDLLTYDRLNSLFKMADEEQEEYFKGMYDATGTDTLFVIDSDGTIVLSSYPEYKNINLVDMGMLDKEQLSELEQFSDNRMGTIGYERDSDSTETDEETKTEEEAKTGDVTKTYHPVITNKMSDGREYYFYSNPIQKKDGENSGYFLAIGNSSQVLEDEIGSLDDAGKILKNIHVGNSGFVFSICPSTNKFLYLQNGDLRLTGKDITEYGLDANVLKDKYSGDQTIDGTEYYCCSRIISSDVYGQDAVFVAAVPVSDINIGKAAAVFAAIMFLAFSSLAIVYAAILRKDFVCGHQLMERHHLFNFKGKKYYYIDSIGKKIIPIFLVGIILTGCVSMFAQTLTAISRIRAQSYAQMEDVKTVLKENTDTEKNISDYYNRQFTNKALIASFVLEMQPDKLFQYDTENADTHQMVKDTFDGKKKKITDMYGNNEYSSANLSILQEICDKSGIDEILIFNDDGRVMAASDDMWYFSLSTDENDQSYPFREVLDGKKNTFVQEARENEVGEYTQYIGCSFYYYTYQGSDGKTCYTTSSDYHKQIRGKWTKGEITKHSSLIQISVLPERLSDVKKSTDISYILSNMPIAGGGYMSAYDDDDDHTVIYSSVKQDIGDTAAETGVSDAAFSGNYSGFQIINGVNCFQSFDYINDMYIAMTIPVDSIYTERNIIAGLTVLLSALFMFLLTVMLTISSDKTDKLYNSLIREHLKKKHINNKKGTDSVRYSAETDQMITIQMPSGKNKRIKAVEARWGNDIIPWEKMSPEQKINEIIKGYVGVLTLVLFIAVIRVRQENDTNAIISYIIGGTWDKGINIFAFTACMMIMLVIFVITWVIKFVVDRITFSMGARAETIGHITESVFRYGGIIGGIFYSLYLLGFNAKSLFTSAGILSIVIGFGAQSLIGDLLAGISIVFEGEFRVGDIVTIGDFRGQVLEIGLRTTKIEDIEKNIKIYNNSTINNIINMTKKHSYAICDVGIEYGEPIERVESVLNAEFPNIKKNLPSMVEGPFYKGIVNLGDSAVVIRIMAKCTENDRIQLQRDLYRELYIVFMRNGISIPFPQVTVSYSNDESKKILTDQESMDSVNFVKTQKEASKNYESEED